MRRRSIIGMAAGIAISVATSVHADRCIGPKDNTVATGFGVDPISPSDITWCDDFDSYCDNNCGDLCNAAWPPHSVWPGYVPTPDNLCSATAMDPSGGPNDVSEFYFRRAFEWPRPSVTGGAWDTSAPSTEANFGITWKGFDGNGGWATDPYVVQNQGGGNTNSYHTFSLLPAIQNRFPGATALNGTDETPLTLRFWTFSALDGGPPSWPMYVELRLDSDHAPTDYVLLNCSPEAGPTGGFPVICQQNNHPGSCPPLSSAVHSSLAFGWLAQLDTNPCNVETGRKPTQYHAAVFEGNKWFQLNASTFPGQVEKFNYDAAQAYFEMKVKSTTMDIKLIAPRHASGGGPIELVTSTATVPRQYTGPFNNISFGASPGCKLDATSGVCVTPGEFSPFRYMKSPAGNSNFGWTPGYIDRMALLGGVPGTVQGACCRPDGTCGVMLQAACTTAGGTFRGIGMTCDGSVCNGACCQPLGVCTDAAYGTCSGNFRGIGTTCAVDGCPCPTPWADVDQDGDVDMDDFGWFQKCYNPAGIAPGCQCADRDHNGQVDVEDFTKFTSCASGADVPVADPGACDQFP